MARPLTTLDVRLRRFPAAYVVLLGAAVGAVGVAPVAGATLSAVALLGAWATRLPRYAGVLGLAPLTLAAGVPWPVPALLAVLLARAGGGRPDDGFVPSRTGPPVRMAAEVVVVAALCAPPAAALAGLSLGNEHPVLSLARPPVLLLGTVVVLAALVNATAEELFWRGWAMRLLAERGCRPRAVVGVQAVSFGAAHAAGIPGGVPGVIGALGLGVVLGVLRMRAAGLTGCVAVHAAVDVTIFSMLAGRIVWVG